MTLISSGKYGKLLGCSVVYNLQLSETGILQLGRDRCANMPIILMMVRTLAVKATAHKSLDCYDKSRLVYLFDPWPSTQQSNVICPVFQQYTFDSPGEIVLKDFVQYEIVYIYYT